MRTVGVYLTLLTLTHMIRLTMLQSTKWVGGETGQAFAWQQQNWSLNYHMTCTPVLRQHARNPFSASFIPQPAENSTYLYFNVQVLTDAFLFWSNFLNFFQLKKIFLNNIKCWLTHAQENIIYRIIWNMKFISSVDQDISRVSKANE